MTGVQTCALPIYAALVAEFRVFRLFLLLLHRTQGGLPAGCLLFPVRLGPLQKLIDLADFMAAGMDVVYAKILKYHAVLIGDIPVQERNQLIKYCFEQNIRCYGIPKITDIMIRHSESIDLFDTPLLLFRNNGLTYRQMFVKRTMDIAISLAGILLSSPVMLLIAAAVKCYDGGPDRKSVV